MIIKDKSVERFGCLRFDKLPMYWPFGAGAIFVAQLTDGTYVAGKSKDYQAWLDSRK